MKVKVIEYLDSHELKCSASSRVNHMDGEIIVDPFVTCAIKLPDSHYEEIIKSMIGNTYEMSNYTINSDGVYMPGDFVYCISREDLGHVVHEDEELDSFAQFQLRVGSWAEKTFPNATNLSITKHLEKEVKELIKSNKPVEAADCYLLLLHHAHKNNYHLYIEAEKKLKYVQDNYVWGEPDEDGVVEHIKEK